MLVRRRIGGMRMIQEIQRECTGLGMSGGEDGEENEGDDGLRIRRLMEEGGGADFEEMERQREKISKLLDTMASLEKARMILSEI